MPLQLETLLETIVHDVQLHARWLNTFSFLEYIGLRKIVKSQNAPEISLAIISHALEEGRHSLLLKNLALKIGGEAFDSYQPSTLLCGSAAEHYFQSVDEACDTACDDAEPRSRLVYYYVTWLIEMRALTVYQKYVEALQKNGMQAPLYGLLNEEERHLRQVEAALLHHDSNFSLRSEELKKIEHRLYIDYLKSVQQEVALRRLPPKSNHNARQY